MDYNIHEFANGIRLIHKQIPSSNISHAGYLIDAGSCDEQHDEQGMAHFIEHMLFKGTKKRKSYQILNRLEGVGGELNAFTTKEKTCVYAACLNHHLPRALELLTDLVFFSQFPDKELQKEKKVIREELDMYRDNPEESIYDDFIQLVYPDHALGYNILGTEECIDSFNKTRIKNFLKRNYLNNRIVLSTINNLPFAKMLKMVEKYIEPIPALTGTKSRKIKLRYKPFRQSSKKSYTQTHCILGNLAYELKNPNRPALLLLSNYLGGPALNSRLNMAIREKYGFTYNIESSYSPFQNTGLFTIQAGTDSRYVERCISLIEKELKLLRDKKISSVKLKQLQEQFKAQIAMAEESRSGLMQTYGVSLLDFNKVDSLEKIFQKIDDVTINQLHEIANEIFDPEQLSYLIYTSE